MTEIIKRRMFFDEEDRKNLKEYMSKNGYNNEKLALVLEITPPLFSMIINGKRAVTKEIASKLKELGFDFKVNTTINEE